MNYCVVERDLAAYERRVEAEDRLEEARDRAIAVERERLDGLTVAELLAERAFLHTDLSRVSNHPLRITIRMDIDFFVQEIANKNVDAAERDRSENA